MKICFVIPNAYGIFDPKHPSKFGGIETQSYTYAMALANDSAHEVSYVVRDEGQPPLQHFGKLSLYSYTPQRPGNAINPVLQKIDADVYITFGINYMSSEVIYNSKQLGKRSLLFIAGDLEVKEEYSKGEEYKHKEGDDGNIYSYSLKFADHIIAQNEHQKKCISELYQRGSFLYPNPIDMSLYSNKNKNDYVLWIGRADFHHKRPLLLIELARLLPGVKFKVVMNPRVPTLAESIKANCPVNIEILDTVDYAEIPEIFSQATAFVSTSAWEGFPNTFLQAGCSSVPILSLDIDPSEIFSQHQCGFYAEGDLKALSSKLGDVWKQPSEMTSEVENMHDYIQKNNSLEVLVSKLNELLVSCEGPLFLDEALSFNFTGNTYVRFVEAYVTEKLKNIIGSSKYIGIYPSGKHTRWLISLLEKNQLLNNIVFLDDKPESAVIPGKVHQITDYDTQLLDKVIFSIDTENPLLHQRAQELFGDKLEFLYQGLPAGPYILK